MSSRKKGAQCGKDLTFTNEVISKSMGSINQSPVDFFSAGHVIIGHVSYLLSYLIMFSIAVADYEIWSILVAVIIAIAWEPIENILLLQYKYEQRQDSRINSFFDIIFNSIGASLAYLIMLASRTYLLQVGYTILINGLVLLGEIVIMVAYSLYIKKIAPSCDFSPGIG